MNNPPRPIDPPGFAVRWDREAAGLGLNQFAERTGISAALLSRIERGLAPISIRNALRIEAQPGMKQARWLLSQQLQYNWGVQLNKVEQALARKRRSAK